MEMIKKQCQAAEEQIEQKRGLVVLLYFEVTVSEFLELHGKVLQLEQQPLLLMPLRLMISWTPSAHRSFLYGLFSPFLQSTASRNHSPKRDE